MATIYVDGKQFEVEGADNLLHACLSLGLDIPYFCWHPALGSVGSCRQCAVKQYNTPEDAEAGRGRLVMSCMTPSTNNTYISITDPEAKAFRASMIEFLMTNHPHDCPVCAEGGSCHLQDMTVMSGHDKRRFRFQKRTYHNQYLGPFISHEMNRCIACYRCVRYYRDYSGGKDLGVFGSASRLYFGRENDGTLQSEFSGNLTEVCPTGVFVDKTQSKHYSRKWDMQYSPSICQQCGVGCNTSPGERYGQIRRIENRYNGDVNYYFLCDRGRFGYGYVNRDDRPRQPLKKVDGEFRETGIDEALDTLADHLKGKKLLGIGSPRASLESNFALMDLVGADNFSTGMTGEHQATVNRALEILQTEGIYTPSLREIEHYDTVLLLGEDVTQTAPRIALSVRQAAKNLGYAMAAEKKTPDWLAEPVARIDQGRKSPVFVLSVSPTRLDDIAESRVVATPHDIARLGFAIARAIRGEPVTGLSDEAVAYAHTVAAQLKAAKKPLVISGTTHHNTSLLEAAADITQSLAGAGLSLVVPEVNTFGTALLGGHSLDEAVLKDYDALIVVENDLYWRLPEKIARQILSKSGTVVVLDHQSTPTTRKADMILPAASFAEADGTAINNEGRAQRFFQVYDPTYLKPEIKIKDSWRWLHALKQTMNEAEIRWVVLDDVIDELARKIPRLSGILDAAPDATYRIQGMKVARAPKRYSGRTAMRAPITVHEPRAAIDPDSPLNFTMEGYAGPLESGALIPFAWAPGWNSPQAWNKYQLGVGGPLLEGNPGYRLISKLPRLPRRSYVEPAAEPIVEGQLRLVATPHIFGSDETSSMAAPIEERMGKPHLTVSVDMASELGLKEDQLVKLTVGDEEIIIGVHLVDDMPYAHIGYPVGFGPVVNMNLPVTVEPLVAPQSAPAAEAQGA